MIQRGNRRGRAVIYNLLQWRINWIAHNVAFLSELPLTALGPNDPHSTVYIMFICLTLAWEFPNFSVNICMINLLWISKYPAASWCLILCCSCCCLSIIWSHGNLSAKVKTRELKGIQGTRVEPAHPPVSLFCQEWCETSKYLNTQFFCQLIFFKHFILFMQHKTTTGFPNTLMDITLTASLWWWHYNDKTILSLGFFPHALDIL